MITQHEIFASKIISLTRLCLALFLLILALLSGEAGEFARGTFLLVLSQIVCPSRKDLTLR